MMFGGQLCFLKSNQQYTVLPFLHLSQSNTYVYGKPVTFTTPAHTGDAACYLSVHDDAVDRLDDKAIAWNVLNNIPDAAFRQYVLDSFDTDHDGELSDDEANAVTRIDCRNKGIANLEGIKRFQNVQYINCSGNPVPSINLKYKYARLTDKSYHFQGGWPLFLKEFIALDMNDSNGNNVLTKVYIRNVNTTVEVPADCIVIYQ